MPDSGRSSHRNSPERGMEQSDMGASQRNTGGEWRADRHGSGSPSTVPPELRSLMERAQTASGDNNSEINLRCLTTFFSKLTYLGDRAHTFT